MSLILLSSILIDVDHYFFYVIKKKDWNPKKAYEWFDEKMEKALVSNSCENRVFFSEFYLLHGLEFLIILFILSFIFPFFLFIFVGASFHLLSDIIYGKIAFNKTEKFSIMHGFLSYKKGKE